MYRRGWRIGFSFVVGFAICAISVIVVVGLFTDALLPSASDFFHSLDKLKNRRVAELYSDITITGVIDGFTGTWWNTSFSFRKRVSIPGSKVADDLSNFPVLIDVVDEDLRSHVQQSNGNDIVFVNGLHNAKYDHEIQQYDSTTGHLIAWVRIPSLNPETLENIFFIYYGNATCESQQNPAGVWDSYYRGVWHFNQESGAILDSTSYENHGTVYGNPTYNVEGKIGGAMAFGRRNAYVSCGDPEDGSLDFGIEDFTIECWVKTTTPESRYIISKLNPIISPTYGYALQIHNTKTLVELADGTKQTFGEGTPPINDGTWRHIAIVVYYELPLGRRWVNYYIDGAYDDDFGPINMGSLNSTFSFDFARKVTPEGFEFFSGDLDEARVSNTLRSAAWINTSFQNQNSPSTFYTFGSETTLLLTLLVENTGSCSLKTDAFSILVNGTKYEFFCNRSFLFPLHEHSFFITTQIPSGPKQIKVIAATNAEDTYSYAG